MPSSPNRTIGAVALCGLLALLLLKSKGGAGTGGGGGTGAGGTLFIRLAARPTPESSGCTMSNSASEVGRVQVTIEQAIAAAKAQTTAGLTTDVTCTGDARSGDWSLLYWGLRDANVRMVVHQASGSGEPARPTT